MDYLCLCAVKSLRPMEFTVSSTSRSAPPSKLPALSCRSAPRVRTAAPATGAATPSRGRLPRPAAATTSSGGGGGGAASTAGALVLFPELPDQLICAPDNSLWVYGQYTLSFFASEAAALTKLEAKLVLMMHEAQRLYEVSRLYYLSLGPAEQRAEVLRSASAASSGGGGTTAAHLIRAAEALQLDEGVYQALREGWPGGAHATHTGRAGEEGERDSGTATSADTAGTAEAAANQQAEDEGVVRYAVGLRVNLVLDIIASRKTLGANPLHSRAYRVAEALYRRVLTPPSAAVTLSCRLRSHLRRGEGNKGGSGVGGDGGHIDPLHAASPHVRSFIIGVSDADVTLVGRDVVCPYRHLQTAVPLQQRMRSALEALVEGKQRPMAASPLLASVAGGAGPLSTSGNVVSLEEEREGDAAAEAAFALASMVAQQVVARQPLDLLLAAPYTRTPPVLLGQLDQARLILCAPPVDWTPVEGL